MGREKEKRQNFRQPANTKGILAEETWMSCRWSVLPACSRFLCCWPSFGYLIHCCCPELFFPCPCDKARFLCHSVFLSISVAKQDYPAIGALPWDLGRASSCSWPSCVSLAKSHQASDRQGSGAWSCGWMLSLAFEPEN